MGPNLSWLGGEEKDEEGEVTTHEGRFVVLYEGPLSTSTASVIEPIESAKADVTDVTKESVNASVYQGRKPVLWIQLLAC